MKDILRPILELSVVLPGLLLAYFPVKSYLKQSPGKLAARILPLMAGLCIGAGIICYQLHASTASALAGITLLAIGLYTGTPAAKPRTHTMFAQNYRPQPSHALHGLTDRTQPAPKSSKQHYKIHRLQGRTTVRPVAAAYAEQS